mmetsp:Transcript_10392/g.34243  ORF Transcript_10392/g.34243 Transcript_10392/m.34243 type:complete len:229 (-) Transcript_10392:847-1533(-)
MGARRRTTRALALGLGPAGPMGGTQRTISLPRPSRPAPLSAPLRASAAALAAARIARGQPKVARRRRREPLDGSDGRECRRCRRGSCPIHLRRRCPAAKLAAAAHAAATAGARHDRRLNSAAARLLKAAEGAEHLAVASKLLRHFRKLCASVLLFDAAMLEVLPLQRDATRRHRLGRQRGEVGDGVAREEGGRDSGKEAQEELAGQRARREQLAAGGREASALVRRWR